jgi:hypothetical protein
LRTTLLQRPVCRSRNPHDLEMRATVTSAVARHQSTLYLGARAIPVQAGRSAIGKSCRCHPQSPRWLGGKPQPNEVATARAGVNFGQERHSNAHAVARRKAPGP